MHLATGNMLRMLYVYECRLFGYTYISQSIPITLTLNASEALPQLWQENAIDTKSVTNMIYTQVEY